MEVHLYLTLRIHIKYGAFSPMHVCKHSHKEKNTFGLYCYWTHHPTHPTPGFHKRSPLPTSVAKKKIAIKYYHWICTHPNSTLFKRKLHVHSNVWSIQWHINSQTPCSLCACFSLYQRKCFTTVSIMGSPFYQKEKKRVGRLLQLFHSINSFST